MGAGAGRKDKVCFARGKPSLRQQLMQGLPTLNPVLRGGGFDQGWVTAQGIQRWGNRESLWEPLTTASAGAEANFLGARASTKSSKCRAASRGNGGETWQVKL